MRLTLSQDIKKVKLNLEPSRIASFADISLGSNNIILSPIQNLQKKEGLAHLDELLETIVFWTAKTNGDQEFIKAQEEFVTFTTKVFYDDPIYHQWTSYFLDYFCFERGFKGAQNATPYQLFMESELVTGGLINTAIRAQIEDLSKFRHSVFRVLKRTNELLVMQDLAEKRKIEVKSENDRYFSALVKGSCLQGFVFEIDGSFKLSMGLIIHPKEVFKIIEKKAKKAFQCRETKMALLSFLAKSHIAAKRLPKIDIRKVYQNLTLGP